VPLAQSPVEAPGAHAALYTAPVPDPQIFSPVRGLTPETQERNSVPAAFAFVDKDMIRGFK
jgi:hypothetical protein